ncbi:TPA: hypothetical protein KRJ43_002745 [Clostridioides difficile]|uniref:Arc-like DNA binding domain-containing protein n=4 Tax=root TaxID=1 RepID=A3QSE8_9CAUD|nr:hypothetical protein [Clostridioides difficile]YP_001110775.1 Arc-like repressor [Clostridioides phage phiC2]YP_009830926.1 Arc-like repressor [Clostridium phage CDKM15]EQE51110.1 hypothetical protein QCG_4112 [Clostridioides difficile CD43]EQE97872.1 hypothetical protein QEA_1131 [Clostridioides difficile CD109]EQG59908.1 hypothetical protein QK3_0989 [Clostridioides difficile DA00145]EQJ48410.1 hypothetical protein QSG_1239 [Clostridioides difficile P25]OFU25694.1 hypothetical protein H
MINMSNKDIYTREEDKRFTLRINKLLFEKIEQLAQKDKRSIGREIEFILEKYFEDNPLE